MDAVPFERWAERIEACVQRTAALRSGHVLRVVDSTQDEARSRDARPGSVVLAWRQERGRGRLGRSWADTVDAGLAMTVVLPQGDSARLSLIGAVAAREACATALRASAEAPCSVPGIKWPNDIVVADRKLAGVLIEQDGRTALMGIGINVAQRDWPPELADRATSLALLGGAIDRIDVACLLIAALDQALRLSDDELVDTFVMHDAMRDSRRRFRCGEVIVEGVVREIDPLRHLRVERDDGTVALLPVALTKTD